MPRHVYFFGGGHADGSAAMKDVLGGKGAGLAEMTNLGVPVPPGFTLSAQLCIEYIKTKRHPRGLKEEVALNLERVEELMGRKLGQPPRPLLVSVRSGAKLSMPGMMDSVLNLGLNDAVAEALAADTGNPTFAYDAYRRFVQMYGNVVMGLKGPRSPFEPLLEEHKKRRKVARDIELPAEDLKTLVGEFKEAIHRLTGEDFPDDPQRQLWGAIEAVWRSWLGERAVQYRLLNHIPETLGTAVNVVAMVFGNMGEDCGTGVAFTRDPSTGAHEFFGEFLMNAQGEDVVAGIRTPQHLTIAAKAASSSKLPAMEEVMPKVFGELLDVRKKLEDRYRDMQDIEFTVERGRLWMLQTRTGKRTAQAALK
ncbi:MAG: PEP/pyruvate-binding domain-containing protein, partial [Gemmatimonadales bacterium]